MKLAAFDAVTSALNAANTRYLVAGGVAVTAHGYIRITTEIELVLAIETGHTHQAFRALAGIGYRPTEPVDADTFARPEQRQRLRQDKGMQLLDFQSDTFASTPVGLLVQAPFDFPREYDQAMRSEILPGVEVRFLSIPTLIRMKQATSSLRDLDDIQHLQWLEEDEIQMHEYDEEPNWSNATFEGARRDQLRRARTLSMRQRLEGLDEFIEVSEHLQAMPRHSGPKTDFIAHKRQSDGERQSLRSHLSEVGEIAAELTRKIGLPNVGRLLGLLHDFGKYSQEFQAYIKSATGDFDQDDDGYVETGKLKGKIDHSSAGAQYVWNKLGLIGGAGQGELCGQILALCIASHHSGLIDCFDKSDEAAFCKRMEKADKKTHLQECQAAADSEIVDVIEQLARVELVKDMFGTIKQLADFNQDPLGGLKESEQFNLGFFTRFLFSCLIDADRLNSAEFEDPRRQIERNEKSGGVSWSIAIERLESKLSELPVRNYVDELRCEISDSCKAKSVKQQGLYTLTVPTGGGKTYASLRYALQHANTHNLHRIIYVIPYTSIIEQNAQAIRSVIELDTDERPWVLEHHSNLEPEQQTWQSKLVSENWDAPIVLTTMVQLLEAMFSGGTRGVRRLHQLANAVLVFDEIQTLPINCVHLFCNALNFLTKHCKTTAVLCTATQPLLTRLKTPDKGQLDIPPENELAGNIERHFVDLSRVDIVKHCKPGGWSENEVAEFTIAQFRQTKSCLVIVNTKAWAKNLYQRCSERLDPSGVFHLSTNQCSAHRKNLLDEIRTRLDFGQPVLCISTQLIEAGVDVDFACVIRFLAGLDSIAQAAGRCNRNGGLKDEAGNRVKGHVYVLNPDQEATGLLKDIHVGKEKAERVMSESHQDLLAPSAIQRYFQYYFFDRAQDMVYPLGRKRFGRDDSLLNLLSGNPLCNSDYSNRSGKLPLMKQAFMEAGRQFKAIDAPTQSVIVPYEEGAKLIVALCSLAKDFDAPGYYKALRQAQKYSVNVFPNVWQRLEEAGAVHEIQEGHGIYYLREEFYSADFGLSTKPACQQSFLGA